MMTLLGLNNNNHQSSPTTSTRKKRTTRNKSDAKTLFSSSLGSLVCILCLTALYLVFLYQTERVLTSVESGQNFRFHSLLFQQPTYTRRRKVLKETSFQDTKFLLFSGNLAGQGNGNIVSGLLAAHLLGDEFNRIVCILDYNSFLEVFEVTDETVAEYCEQIVSTTSRPSPSVANSIRLVNYEDDPNECQLQKLLQSNERVIYMTGNTYPWWPHVPNRYFLQHYRPKKILLDALPYNPQLNPPTTVVHLRWPDNGADRNRRGLDDTTLNVLGRTLPKDTYLVTNHVALYKQFTDCCQWSHPTWNTVIHSALNIKWDETTSAGAGDHSPSQNVQLWADWYTLLLAQTIYHTHSDFSISAAHWMNNKNSHSIHGVDKDGTQLITNPDPWASEGDGTPLSKRTVDGSGGAHQLRYCDEQHGLGRVADVAALLKPHLKAIPKHSPPRKDKRHRRSNHRLNRNNRDAVESDNKSSEIVSRDAITTGSDDRFLIFDGMLHGQGTGNIISGLLSAHLFGQEFNRIVCILPENYYAFLEVFEPIGKEAVAKCPAILAKGTPVTEYNRITLINYIGPPDECELKDKLSSTTEVLYLYGNTYPRWPVVPDGFFLQHYRAKQVLLDALPYDPHTPPSTVVHLRAPDDNFDVRVGLDDATLTALGKAVPHGKDTYLVTNRVAYYKQFEDCCQWSHPKWNSVKHSAIGAIDWGDIGIPEESTVNQNVRMWADWYTILTARAVYHTHSDFSISAIHWMNIQNTYSIVGTDKSTGLLETKAESWRIDGETAPLSQRTLEAEGTSQLRWCNNRREFRHNEVNDRAIEDMQQQQNPQTQPEVVQRGAENETPVSVNKFLMFDGILASQGVGNIVSGLLSAHLLGQEFNRTVCVMPNFEGFLEVFEAIGAEAVAKCGQVTDTPDYGVNGENYITLVNFDSPPNECALKEKLASDMRVLFLNGNTYPRWPTVPDGFFLMHYRPKPILLEALPYEPLHPPTTVVHLRQPDDAFDSNRLGLDDASLAALGDALPKGNSTYLVTNRVEFFSRFEKCCGWSHATWNSVRHSALGIDWGSLDVNDTTTKVFSQNVQMWADWYTILIGKTVYHTHSDFSISAIHWMNNKDSHSIVGVDPETGKLQTKIESWWIDGETAPLSQRTLEASGTSQLRLCGGV